MSMRYFAACTTQVTHKCSYIIVLFFFLVSLMLPRRYLLMRTFFSFRGVSHWNLLHLSEDLEQIRKKCCFNAERQQPSSGLPCQKGLHDVLHQTDHRQLAYNFQGVGSRIKPADENQWQRWYCTNTKFNQGCTYHLRDSRSRNVTRFVLFCLI